ncbi:MAG: branched-chain amino acid transport system ATP-binding protein livF, partial [Alphaproteobacteria bacterium]|nr:branched-chain amino acid transport system ATP-binding protein livF [Alphaproteobacteria bacterium]
ASVLVLPFVLQATGLTLTTATDVIIFAVACMGLNILVGQTGLVSFGHGAFFGLAGYAAALSQRHWFPGDIVIPAVFSVVSVALFAWLAGFLILRRRGVYFSLLTLALSAMLFAIAFRWTAVTGGESGLGGVVRPAVLGVDLDRPWTYYWAVAAIGLLVVFLLWRFHRSPVGHVLVAVRENEQRARFIGYPTDRYKLFAFTISAAITGLAGTLSVFHHRFASADPLSVQFSGELLAMVVIGGMRSFLGPALGALFFILFREFLSIATPHWLLYFGLLFVGFIVFSPTGLVGVAARVFAPFRKRETEAAAMADRAIAKDAPLPAALADRKAAEGPVLIARELAKSFGGIRAVAKADIVVHDRTLHALIGPNGAGKTTAFNLLSGLYAPDAGFITVAGHPIAGLDPEDITRAGVGRSFQITNLFGGLSVEENVRLAVQARHRKRFAWWSSAEGLSDVNAETAAFISYLGLSGMEPAEAASLSYGGQRLLDMGLALATAPHILLLDEPLAGLAAAERTRVAALVKTISQQIPVLLVEHDIDRVFEIADEVTVMNEGAVLVHGSVDDARNNAKVREIYIGSGTAHITAEIPPSAAGAATLLNVDKVNTLYGKSHILHDVSLDVSENEIVALLGRNGAGKSTLLKTLIGIAPPETGSIKLAGEEIARLASAPIARRGIGYVPQGRGLFAGMTVADNLALGRLKRRGGEGVHWDDDRIVWVFPRLAQRWYTPADYLSGGEQQMVAVARALAGNVRLLLLDEPFEGLSPAITEELFEAFNRLRFEIAMVIVDHHLDLALALSDRTVILERGAVSWTGASKLLRDDLDLRRQKLWM